MRTKRKIIVSLGAAATLVFVAIQIVPVATANPPVRGSALGFAGDRGARPARVL